jgi:hypothetical protein
MHVTTTRQIRLVRLYFHSAFHPRSRKHSAPGHASGRTGSPPPRRRGRRPSMAAANSPLAPPNCSRSMLPKRGSGVPTRTVNMCFLM